jgi:ABC-type molybdate transport system substrate-binding protein
MRRVALAVSMLPAMADAAEPVLLHAAGSLRTALGEVAGAYEKQTGVKVIAKYLFFHLFE